VGVLVDRSATAGAGVGRRRLRRWPPHLAPGPMVPGSPTGA